MKIQILGSIIALVISSSVHAGLLDFLLGEDEAPVGSSDLILGPPSDYFPTDVGRRWVYDITIPGPKDPLYSSIRKWPIGNGKVQVSLMRGIYYTRGGSNNQLIMEVKGSASHQGPLEYPDGIEIEIERDDLGIFNYHTGVFFATTEPHAEHLTLLVTLYDKNSPGSPHGSWGNSGATGDGYGRRIFFFSDRPGVGRGIKGEGDQLAFMGPISVEGKECLQFLREVEAQDIGSSPSYLEKGFREYLLFCKGLGLTHLRQMVDGETTMEWQLRQ